MIDQRTTILRPSVKEADFTLPSDGYLGKKKYIEKFHGQRSCQAEIAAGFYGRNSILLTLDLRGLFP